MCEQYSRDRALIIIIIKIDLIDAAVWLRDRDIFYERKVDSIATSRRINLSIR